MLRELHQWKFSIIVPLALLASLFVGDAGVIVHDCVAQDSATRRSTLDNGGEPKLAPELKALNALRQFRTQQEGRVAGVSVEEPINTTEFPEKVKAFVLVVDSSGRAVEGLDSRSFAVREQRVGEAMQEPRELRVSELSLEVTKADIVFVVDQSGSMEDEIATVRDGIQRFAELLSESQINFRLGGVSYEGEGWGGIGLGRTTDGFIGNYENGITTMLQMEEFKQWARSIPATGGEERGYDAIVTVTQPPFIYRSDAQQIICLVTDEDNDPGASDISQAYNEIGEKTLFYFNTQVDPEFIEETDRDYEQLGTRLGGAFDEQALLEVLGGIITRKYIIEYTSPWPEKDCIPRELIVTVTDPGDEVFVAQDTKHYTPGSQGAISGAISDRSTGELLQDVSVSLLQNRNIVAQVLTDEQGYYSFEELCKGNYTVRVTKVGYKTQEDTAALVADRVKTIDFELLPSTGIEEKEALIAQLEKISQYSEEEQLAKQYLDKLDLNSPEALEALRRLILAENLVNEAYINAEQRANIAGLAIGTTLVFLVDDILITKAIKKVVDRLIPQKLKFSFFGKEIEQTRVFIDVKEEIFEMLDDTIVEVTNNVVIYAVQVIPDTASVLKNEVTKLVTKALYGVIMEDLSVEEIVGRLIEGPLLILYADFTDEALEQSVYSAEDGLFAGTYENAERAVADQLIFIIQGTDEIRDNVEGELASVDMTKNVQAVAGSVANISAVFSASGVMGVVSAVARLVEIGSIAVKYGFSGYAAGTSIYSLLVDLPRQVDTGTAVAFGRGAWQAPQLPANESPMFTGALLSQASVKLRPIRLAPSGTMTQAEADLIYYLDWLIELIETDELVDALELTAEDLLPASEEFRRARNVSESEILAVGGNIFENTPLFELRYRKLAALSPDTSLQTVAFFTNLLAFFWQASEVSSPSDPNYLQSKADIVVSARSLRDKVQELSEELEAASTLIQGVRIVPTVIIADAVVTSDGYTTTTISRARQRFTVTATLRNLTSYDADDFIVRLVLTEGSTLNVVTDRSIHLSYLPGGQSAEVDWGLQHSGPTMDARNAVILSIEPVDPERTDFNTFPPTVLIIASPSASLSPPTGGKLSNMDVYAYPNPFNPDMGLSNVRYSLSEDTNVTIEIYDASGKLVTTLMEEQPKEKIVEYSEPWDGTNDQGDTVANGVYFYLITTTGNEKAAGKIAVLR